MLFSEKMILCIVLIFTVFCCGCIEVKEEVKIEEPFTLIEVDYSYSLSYYDSNFPIANFPMYLGMSMDSEKINYTSIEWTNITSFSEEKVKATSLNIIFDEALDVAWDEFELSNLEVNVTSLDRAILENSTKINFVSNITNDQGMYAILEASMEYKRYESVGDPIIEEVGDIAVGNLEDSLITIYGSSTNGSFEYELDAEIETHHYGTIHNPIGDYITSDTFEKVEILDSDSGWNNPAVFYNFIFEDVYNTYGDFNHEEQYKEVVINDDNHRTYSFEYQIRAKGNRQIIHIYSGTLDVKKL